MPQFYWGNLKDAVSRPATANKPIYATTENAWRSDVRKRIQDLNDFAEAHDTHQSGTSRMVPYTRGRIEADTTTSGQVALYADPDGLGADDQIATRLRAQDISFGTGGTATFKLGGAIDVNTTQVSAVGVSDLMTYTVPDGTLAADGQVIEVVGFATRSADTANFSYGFGSASNVFGGGTAITDLFFKSFVVRTSAGQQKIFSLAKTDRDGAGLTALVVDTFSSLTGDIVSKLRQAGTATATQEIMLTKLL